ncbi:MAG TPA: DUF547 domain-containing protein [Candidatus Competibacteraceae bacterium]|nr:DUF547 domain-containing protein [Candidatus Competibacteraceae bacterium]MCP5134004.1 DUF547 domain-containing protein [Gammaproteobacteria bacterium]HPF58423.1 DUF547 domain-containing protein [Candidatus Competibacteraceae bacterium]HRY17791.1 DUF547 domain-containing protein [Candidatus Competibacteraceae bacterium]
MQLTQQSRWLIVLTLLFMTSLAQAAFDHRHTAWNTLLNQHVVLIEQGHASQVDYAGFKADQAALKSYLDRLSAVSEAEYRRWSKPQQLAFLINAYNAFTVDLILTRYPDLKSIKDLGSVFQSPWKKVFFTLLDQERSLDHVEHGMIRAPGVFNEPRIHVAVNCASIGCPMLRNEAFVASTIETQLDDSMRRFLADRSRNRFDAANQTLLVSKIFDWYQDDFAKGYQGFTSLNATFARYADVLGDTPQTRDAIRKGGLNIRYLDYDWALNATQR